jgi:hypothetical protein
MITLQKFYIKAVTSPCQALRQGRFPGPRDPLIGRVLGRRQKVFSEFFGLGGFELQLRPKLNINVTIRK